MDKKVWFWQRIISPHMVGLAVALSEHGYHVTYIVERAMSESRAEMGWQIPELKNIKLEILKDKTSIDRILHEANSNVIHVTQGFRGNGIIKIAQKLIRERKLLHFIIMETVDDSSGVLKYAKILAYIFILSKLSPSLKGVLAIGYATPHWLVSRGMDPQKVFPFSYFLPETVFRSERRLRFRDPLRLLFVGQLIARKDLSLAISVLADLSEEFEFQLDIVGGGELEAELKAQGARDLPGRVNWLGQKSSGDVPSIMRGADYLILPSRHDGWGAVVSEALMVGTPAICSDRCGCAKVVERSGVGGVFRAGDHSGLYRLLRRLLQHGRLPEQRRRELAQWALVLGAHAGAAYLAEILEWRAGEPRPVPPWLRISSTMEGEHLAGDTF